MNHICSSGRFFLLRPVFPEVVEGIGFDGAAQRENLAGAGDASYSRAPPIFAKARPRAALGGYAIFTLLLLYLVSASRHSGGNRIKAQEQIWCTPIRPKHECPGSRIA